MLCQFTVKNFKSIRDEATFDMQAAAISEHEDRIIIDKDEKKYLPVSAIYGPNGGGKSNVLAALHTLVAKVLRPLFATEDNEEKVSFQKRIIVEPFAFSESKDEPTEFDLSTMNSEVFRRDEIWFVAKGNAQNSKLYSLVEFKFERKTFKLLIGGSTASNACSMQGYKNEKGESVRKDAKFDKQYLEGKYGADPYLRRIVDWGNV